MAFYLLNIIHRSQHGFHFYCLYILYGKPSFQYGEKKYARGLSPFKPDSIHLHMLIYKRIVRPKFRKIKKRLRNSLTSPYLWIVQILCTIPAVLFWRNTTVLIGFCIAFALFYVWLYFKIVKFKTPKILRF